MNDESKDTASAEAASTVTVRRQKAPEVADVVAAVPATEAPATDASATEATATDSATHVATTHVATTQSSAMGLPSGSPATEGAAPVPASSTEASAAPTQAEQPERSDKQFATRSRGRGGRGGRKVVRAVQKSDGMAEAVAPRATSADAWKAKASDAGGSNFADLFADAAVPTAKSVSVGDEVKGTIVHSGAEGVFIDLGGARQQAFFPRLELSEAQAKLAVGDALSGWVTKIDDGTPVLGRGLGKGMSSEEFRAAMEDKIPVEGKVSGVNKGGVSVDLGGLRAFCPIGQLELRYVNDASIYLNQTLRFHVIEIKGDRDVVLSRRAILEEEQTAKRAELAEKLTPGTRLTGQIARVVEFGAFVDLGGIDGLIPTRELSYDRRRPDQVVSTGQSVEVMIQEVTEKDGDLRITLSLKALADDPWDAVERLAPVGVVAQGVVRRLMDFGAFVELAPGIEGLLHVSELGGGARHPSSSLNVGEAILVTVQSLDRGKKRISLAPAPKDAPAGTRVTAPTLGMGQVVTVVVDHHEHFGVFVQVEGVAGKAGRGLVHEKELGLEHGVDMKKSFPIGKSFQAKVIDTKRLALSVKAIAEDEARATVKEYQEAAQKTQSFGTFADLLKGKT